MLEQPLQSRLVEFDPSSSSEPYVVPGVVPHDGADVLELGSVGTAPSKDELAGVSLDLEVEVTLVRSHREDETPP